MKNTLKTVLFTSLFYTHAVHCGIVEYQPEKRILLVKRFPEDAPATMRDLFLYDRENNWNVVTYDNSQDTYTINADLWLGSKTGLGTFMQIGTSDHPRENLIMKGNVWILPSQKSVRRPDGRLSIINRLRIGNPDLPDIKAKLMFDSNKSIQYGLLIGDLRNRTGELHIFNSTLTSLKPGKDHFFVCKKYLGQRCGWLGSDIRLINATISGFGGVLAYGLNPQNNTISNSTFENGDIALQTGPLHISNCIFRNLRMAMSSFGITGGGTFVNCVFENNDYNFRLGASTCKNIALIDCLVKPQKKPPCIAKNRATVEQMKRLKVSLYPSIFVQCSLVVKVIDENDQPVPMALVSVHGKENGAVVLNGAMLTSVIGLTVQEPEMKRIIITRKQYRATDDPEQPKEINFSYLITVKAKNYQTSQYSITPETKTIPYPFIIKIKRKRLE